MSVFIAWPWLALLPASLLLVLYRASRRGVVALGAACWMGYAVYEYAMQRHWLCSGECNIRVDLLLLYPLLAGVSVWALVAARSARRGRPGP